MIAGAIQENLCFVFEPAKCARVNDSGAVALKFGPIAVALLRILSAARIARLLRERRERRLLGRFHFLARPPAVLHAHTLEGTTSVSSQIFPGADGTEPIPPFLKPYFIFPRSVSISRAERARCAWLAIAARADRKAPAAAP